MDLFREFEINDEAAVGGVWHDLSRDVEVLVAMEGNAEYTRLLRKKYKANETALQMKDDLANQLSEDIMKEVYASTILKGIRAKEGADADLKIDGEPYDGRYTPAIGLKLLQNQEFFKRIQGFAGSTAEFKKYQEDELVKN